MNTGKINVTPRAEDCRGEHSGAYSILSLVEHAQFDQAVIDQNLVADRHVLNKSRVIHVHGIWFFAFRAAHSELQNVPRLEIQVGLDVPCANGWSLCIEQNRNRAACCLRESADSRHNLADPFMSGMTHVKPENIGASLD